MNKCPDTPVLGHSLRTSSIKSIRLFLVRHGESQANTVSAQFVSGRSSYTPLTELGKDQARKLGLRWKVCASLMKTLSTRHYYSDKDCP